MRGDQGVPPWRLLRPVRENVVIELEVELLGASGREIRPGLTAIGPPASDGTHQAYARRQIEHHQCVRALETHRSCAVEETAVHDPTLTGGNGVHRRAKCIEVRMGNPPRLPIQPIEMKRRKTGSE